MKRVLTLILVLLSSISLAFAAVNLNTATVDELDGVKGFGEKSIAKLRSELTVGDGAAKAAVKK